MRRQAAQAAQADLRTPLQEARSADRIVRERRDQFEPLVFLLSVALATVEPESGRLEMYRLR